MTNEERKKRAIDMLMRLDAGDVEGILPYISDDFTFEPMRRSQPGVEGSVRTVVDRESFLAFVPGVLQLTEDGMNLEVDTAIADGDHVALFGTSDAMTRKGQPYSNVYCWHFRFDGDRIAQFREYADQHLVHTVLRA